MILLTHDENLTNYWRRFGKEPCLKHWIGKLLAALRKQEHFFKNENALLTLGRGRIIAIQIGLPEIVKISV